MRNPEDDELEEFNHKFKKFDDFMVNSFVGQLIIGIVAIALAMIVLKVFVF